MSLALVTHELSLAHRTPLGHPERVDRVIAVVDGIRGSQAEILDVVAPPVDRSLLELVHDADYIDDIHGFCVAGGGSLDPDTHAVPATWDAAIHAAGAGPRAIDTLLGQRADTAFVAVRPPGHHAERHQAMGFCFFNNIAVAAAYLRGFGERIAIVDWDVHHGNGTQHTFYGDPDVLYMSMHEFPFYPGTGWITETGSGIGDGMTVNVALPSGTSSDSYLAAFGRIVIPVLEAFAPDWLLISAGYDAHVDDPLGGLSVSTEAYASMAAHLTTVVPANRTVSFLEGGYDLEAIAAAAGATVEGALGLRTIEPLPDRVEGSAARLVDLAVESLAAHWEVR